MRVRVRVSFSVSVTVYSAFTFYSIYSKFQIWYIDLTCCGYRPSRQLPQLLRYAPKVAQHFLKLVWSYINKLKKFQTYKMYFYVNRLQEQEECTISSSASVRPFCRLGRPRWFEVRCLTGGRRLLPEWVCHDFCPIEYESPPPSAALLGLAHDWFARRYGLRLRHLAYTTSKFGNASTMLMDVKLK